MFVDCNEGEREWEWGKQKKRPEGKGKGVKEERPGMRRGETKMDFSHPERMCLSFPFSFPYRF